MEKLSVKYKNNEITYFLTKKRNIKNINLRIKEDLNIYISAPYGIKKEYIKNFVIQRADWINDAKIKIENQNRLKNKKSEENKNTFYYLGNKYNIKFIKADKKSIVLNADTVVVSAPGNEKINIILDEFIKKEGTALIYAMLKDMSVILEFVGLHTMPEIKLRKMKSRWGSCHYTANKVILNTELFKKPKLCVYYVLLHELCHFKVPNHSKDFYKILCKFMPNWKETKKTLNNM